MRNHTPHERMMKRMLTDLDIKFKQQFIIPSPTKSFYILDFMLLDLAIAVEVDGDHHTRNPIQAMWDRERTAHLNRLGVQVIRINNHALTNSKYEDTKKYLYKTIQRIKIKQIKLF
jgi:very-short-patch-repair endonuclease